MKRTPDQTVLAAGILLLFDGRPDKHTDKSLDAPMQFLLMRHPKRWDLPKGHCEPGETFEQTALRETEEETGIPAAKIQLDPDFHFDLHYQTTYKSHGQTVFHKHVRYFLGRIDHRPKLVLTEHESAQWFDWSPPHQIQTQTIDPLLNAVADHLRRPSQRTDHS